MVKKEAEGPDLNTLLSEVETIGNLGLDASVIGDIRARLKAEHELSIQVLLLNLETFIARLAAEILAIQYQ